MANEDGWIYTWWAHADISTGSRLWGARWDSVTVSSTSRRLCSQNIALNILLMH